MSMSGEPGMGDWLDAEAHADRAIEMYERGRWAEAEYELRRALSLNPDQAEWHFSLGLTLEAAGRDPEALACYERAVALAPELIEPLLAAATVSNRLGRHDQAITWTDRALTLAASETAYAQKIDALTRLGDHDEAEATFYLAQHTLDAPSAHCYASMAESLFERGAFGRAEWCLKEALRLEPQYPRLRARLAAVLASTDRPQRALQMYLRDLRDDPGNIDTLLDYGELLVDLGRLPEAAEKFRRVLEQEPANVDAHERLGRIAMMMRRHEQAHLEFELVMKLDPEYPGIRIAIAEAQLRRGLRDAAREQLREELDRRAAAGSAAESSPSLPDTPAALREESPAQVEHFATLLLDAGLPNEAAGEIEAAIERRGTACTEHVGLMRKLAVARFRSGDVDGGVTASRRVLRFEACASAYHNLALAALEAGQLRVAAGWISRGLRLHRHDDGLRRLRMQLWLAWLRAAGRRVLGRRN
jgi:tetratricopeptide (TPR) repeat protein